MSARDQYGEVVPSLRRQLRSVLCVLVPLLLYASASVLVPMGWLGVEHTWTVLAWLGALLFGLSGGLYALMATADVAIAVVERVEILSERRTRRHERAAGTLSLVGDEATGALSAAERGRA